MDAKPAGFSPGSSLQPTTILLVEDEKGVRAVDCQSHGCREPQDHSIACPRSG